MEQVAEQPHILKPAAAQKRGGISLPVEEIGFVAVERFVEEHLSVAGGPPFQRCQGVGQQILGAFPRHLAPPPPLHRANDRRCAEFAGGVDDVGDKLLRCFPAGGFWGHEMELVFHPAGARAHRRQPQAVGIEHPRHVRSPQLGRAGWKNLHGIEPQLGRHPASFGKRRLAVKHKGPLDGFGDQTDRDGREHERTHRDMIEPDLVQPRKSGRR